MSFNWESIQRTRYPQLNVLTKTFNVANIAFLVPVSILDCILSLWRAFSLSRSSLKCGNHRFKSVRQPHKKLTPMPRTLFAYNGYMISRTSKCRQMIAMLMPLFGLKLLDRRLFRVCFNVEFQIKTTLLSSLQNNTSMPGLTYSSSSSDVILYPVPLPEFITRVLLSAYA